MRENRPYGSEGGEGQPFPTPIGGGLPSHYFIGKAWGSKWARPPFINLASAY